MAEALDGVIPADVEGLARQVLEAACQRGLQLVTAESVTGGLLASLLTDIPGLSHAFDRGFVAYAEKAKTELLGVPREMLARETAVSEAVARAMAEGALTASRGHLAVAITGYAEAAPGTDQQAGLVHFAVAGWGVPTRHRRERFGDIGRAAVRIACLRCSLEMLRERIVLAPRPVLAY